MTWSAPRVLLAAIAWALAAPLQAGEAPQVVRGPYLQQGRDDGIVIRWRTDVPTDSAAWIGPAPGALSLAASDPTPVTDHAVAVDGLSADQEYFYAVGTAAGPLAGDDDAHRFTTAPLPGTDRPTRIWVVGDSGTGDVNAEAVRDAYETFSAATDTDLWLMLGDNAYPDGTDDEYQSALFDIYTERLRRTPLWPTLGNHDGVSADSATQTGAYYDIFSLPDQGQVGGWPSNTEAYYSFDHANIHFVVLESFETDRAPFAPMLTWLEQDLASTAQDWIVAFWHHPPYSKGSHDSDTELELVEMREHALPILEDHGVDLVLTGHSHSYERSYLIDGAYMTPTPDFATLQALGHVLDAGDGSETGDGPYEQSLPGPEPHQGTVYVVAGSSGKTTGGPLNHPAMRVSLDSLGSLVLDVDGQRLDGTFLDETGTVRDRFTILKGVDCPNDPANDDDGDGRGNACDNCPSIPNADQTDRDEDGAGDVCDPCPLDADDDLDGDGVCGDVDNCAAVANSDQADLDNDGTGDLCDDDDDGDGVVDGLDCAPRVRGVSTAAGAVGDTLWLDKFGGTTLRWRRGSQGHTTNVYRSTGSADPGDFSCFMPEHPETDLRDPGIPSPGSLYFYLVGARNVCGDGALGPAGDPSRGVIAPCPQVWGDFDVDGVVDVEDNCPPFPNATQSDFDLDFVGDPCDNCPATANGDQADADGDLAGDVCDTCTDSDGDAHGDPGYPAATCPQDNCPAVHNLDQLDADLDEIGDVCDPCPQDPGNDDDVDGVCAAADNCPAVSNPAQIDSDGDSRGDVCDVCPLDAEDDGDGDGFCADADNCPVDANPLQVDTDADGAGDSCDADDDNDGTDDGDDCAPLAAGVSAAPLPIGDGLRVEPDAIDWPLSYQGRLVHLYRSGSADGGFACYVPAVAGGSFADTAAPSPGETFFYLASAVNGCGESDPGADSAGLVRTVDVTCVLAPGDRDSDGVDDGLDNCPATANPGQEDGDGDFVGDACDNCPTLANPSQVDPC